VYELAIPIHVGSLRTGPGNLRSTSYMLAVKAGLAIALGADPGYVGLLTQNPLHADWRTLVHDYAYTLEELARELPRGFLERLGNGTRSQQNRRGPLTHPLDQMVGRNVDCFEHCRKIAYRMTGLCISEAELQARILVLVRARNCQYQPPMLEPEVRSIARSISRFCWRNRSTLYATARARSKRRGILQLPSTLTLPERQRLGANYTNETRAADTRTRIERAIGELGSGASLADIADRASVSPSSVARYRRAVKSDFPSSSTPRQA